MAKAKAAKKAPTKKAAPTKAKTAKPVKAAKSVKAVKPASKGGAKGDVHVEKLIEIAGECMPKDQIAPIAALLEAYDLAKQGALSPKTTLAVWRAGTTPTLATSEKARKGQQKLFVAAGFEHGYALVIDCAKRFLAAAPAKEQEERKSVAWLYIQALMDTEKTDEGIAAFKQYTDEVLKAGRAGAFDRDPDWIGTWFGTYLWKLDLAGRKDEHARVTKLQNAEKARS